MPVSLSNLDDARGTNVMKVNHVEHVGTHLRALSPARLNNFFEGAHSAANSPQKSPQKDVDVVGDEAHLNLKDDHNAYAGGEKRHVGAGLHDLTIKESILKPLVLQLL